MEKGDEGWEEKIVGKTYEGTPFITCQKNLLIPDLCPQLSLA